MFKLYYEKQKQRVKRCLTKLYKKSTDLCHHVIARRVYLRPSEILYTQEVISPIIIDKEGVKFTVFDLLREAIKRVIPIETISLEVTVVYRPDRRGHYSDRRSRNEIGNRPGWWAIKGLSHLWVLKALEERGYVGAVKVKCMETISESEWNIVCNRRLLDGGKRVEGIDKGQLEIEKHATFMKRRKDLTPPWEKVITANESPKSMHLGDYEPEETKRHNKSCTGYGICHAPVKHYEEETDPNSDEDHRCQRWFVTIFGPRDDEDSGDDDPDQDDNKGEKRKLPKPVKLFATPWSYWLSFVFFGCHLAALTVFIATTNMWLGRRMLPVMRERKGRSFSRYFQFGRYNVAIPAMILILLAVLLETQE